MYKLYLFLPKKIYLKKPQCKVHYKQKRFINEQSGFNERQKQILAKGLPQKKVIKGVKHVVLISSGKGGVGKSTTAVNLATAVAELNPSLSVGLLDADVFGPSVPLMMNLNDEPLFNSENRMVPLVNHGVKCMSMGFLIPQESAVIWRGLMVMQAVQRLLFDVEWGPTDVLFVDTPPGTGDTHLTIIQHLFISGALVVTTPQQAALQVAQRGVTMLRKLDVPVIGLVHNMSSFVCSSCNNRNDLFGPAINKFASELGINMVQDIPLYPEISWAGDRGIPVVVSHSNSPISAAYKDLASKVVTFLGIVSK